MADNNEEEKKDDDKKDDISSAAQSGAPNQAQQAPLTDQNNEPIADGQIPQDNAGVETEKYDPLDPIGKADIKFAQGNYQQFIGIPKLAQDKVQQVTQTLVPLIEVALIELVGSSNMYKRMIGQCYPAFDNQGKMSIQFTFQYSVPAFIGMDIDLEAIKHDSNYILTKIKAVEANITKCEINCAEGTVLIQGSI